MGKNAPLSSFLLPWGVAPWARVGEPPQEALPGRRWEYPSGAVTSLLANK